MHMYDLCVIGYVSLVCGYVCGVCVAYGPYVVCSPYVLLCGCVCGRQVGGILPVSDETCLFQVLQAEVALEQDNGVVNMVESRVRS